MPTAFVTGGTGLLGRNLAGLLLREGWRVVCIHRPSASTRYLRELDVELVAGDLVDLDAVVAALPEGVDAVFHCAADANFWSKRNAAQYASNVLGTRNMVEAALRRGARRFVNTSTIVAFGPNGGRPITAGTSQTPDPRINLAVTKKLAEDEVRAAMARGLDAVFLNPAGIVGPYDLRGWAGMFFPVARGEPQYVPAGGIMPWCHVDEVARAHLAAFERAPRGATYLLGGVETDWGGYLESAARVMGRSVEVIRWPGWALGLVARVLLVGDRMLGRTPQVTPQLIAFLEGVYRCDSGPAMRDLGFRITPLDDMVRDSYEWLVREGFLKPPLQLGG
jgi:dihydroflavonol-4-reductase